MPATRRAAPQFPRTIAIINSNDDLVRIIREALEDEGYNAVTGHIVEIKSGKLNLERFLSRHQPNCIVYDVAPPYDESWAFLQSLLRRADFSAPALVITTVNKRELERAVGRTGAFEVVGTRDTLGPIVEAVNRRVRWTIEHTPRPRPVRPAASKKRTPAKRRPSRSR